MLADTVFNEMFGEEAKNMRERGKNFVASKKVVSFKYCGRLRHLEGEVERSKNPGSHSVHVSTCVSLLFLVPAISVNVLR